MDDYISREAVLKCVDEDGYRGEYDLGYPGHNVRFQELLKEIPAADVVEVVRCRDCKHRPVVTDESHPYGFGLACPKEGAYQDVTCPYLCDDGYYNRMPADGWYCAEGERRADNG